VYGSKSDSRLEPTGLVGGIDLHDHFPIHAGCSYTQPAHTFHDSEPRGELVVTVMEKTEIHSGDAYVLVPVDKPPDNDFDRANAAPTEVIWDAIERSLA
jgi:hypothetical protein